MVEEKKPSCMYDHYMVVYNHMKEQAVTEEVDGLNTLVYTGFLTHFMKEARLPIPYHTYITRALEKTQMAIQLRRGAGKAPSRWMITSTIATRTEIEAALSRVTSKPQGKTAAMEQRIKDLTFRVEQLEQMMTIASKAVESLQQTVEYIETKVDTTGMNI